MTTRCLVFITVAALFTGCTKPAGPASAPTIGDPVEQKLMELSGGESADCGRLKVEAQEAQLRGASDCALQAAQSKRPFRVAYDMPGMSIGIAGDKAGKLFAVQMEPPQPASSQPCPSELRVAPSGRVTCFAPGAFSGGAMGNNPHGAMDTPAMENPHDSVPKRQ